MSDVLRIYGASMTDTIYSIDFRDGRGEISWNVTRIMEACRLGRFGSPLDWVGEMPEIDDRWRENTDIGKIEFFKRRPDILAIPLIAVQSGKRDDCDLRCFIDGNHRLIAMTQLGIKTFKFYLVPGEVEKSYRVEFITS